VSYRVVNGTTFQPLASVNYVPFTSNTGKQHSSIVSLTDTTGTLATHVDAVRFVFSTASGVASPSGQVVREIEVLGQPSTGPTLPPPPARPNLGVVLPLGDSITWGDQAVGGPVPGGYRTKLFTTLDAAGYDFTYAGSQTSNASLTLANAGQVNNEGHNGYRIDQIFNNLTASDGTGGNNGGHWLDGGGTTGRPAVDPKFILLHIGTNDILQHFDPNVANAPEAVFMADLKTRLNALVDRLTTQRPDAHLLVSSIVPIPNLTNANGVADNAEVKDYNAYIRDVLVPTFKGLGRDVTFVDQYANFVDANGNVLTSFFPDNIHPNQAGYDLMGATWANAIQQAVPEPGAIAVLGVALGAVLTRRGRRGRSCR
jgi:lysophospholipase L1-like esterase